MNNTNSNTSLIRILGVLGVACVAATTYILTSYKGDQIIAIGALATIAGTFVTALLGFRQSVANASMVQTTATIAQNAVNIAQNTVSEVKAIKEDVKVNTEKTDETHGLVNGQTQAYKEMMDRFAAMQAQLAAAVALAEGITEGRRQVTDAAVTQPAEILNPGPDGAVEVVAPAVIKVIAPGETNQP